MLRLFKFYSVVNVDANTTLMPLRLDPFPTSYLLKVVKDSLIKRKIIKSKQHSLIIKV